MQLADWIQEAGKACSLELALNEADRIRDSYLLSSTAEKRYLLRWLFPRIEISQDALCLEVDRTSIVSTLIAGQPGLSNPQSPLLLRPQSIVVSTDVRKRGVETKLILTSGFESASVDSALVALVARAHVYLRKLTEQASWSLADVAAGCGAGLSEVSRILPLAFLAADSRRIRIDGSATGPRDGAMVAEEPRCLMWLDCGSLIRIPTIPVRMYGAILGDRVRQRKLRPLTLNQRVAGSIPASPTITIN